MRQMMLLLMAGLCLAAPAMADGPTVKFSFVMPVDASNEPVAHALDPDSLYLWQLTFRAHENFFAVDNRFRDGNAQVSGVGRGIRLRVHATDTPLGWDVAWIRGRRSHIEVQSLAQDGVTLSDRGSLDRQTNRHTVDLHTFRFGFRYDLLYRSRRFSLEPGVGLEQSVARHTHSVHHTRETSQETMEVVQDKKETSWNGGDKKTLYLSMDAEVFPFGKRGIGIGVHTRYLPRLPTWELGGGSLAGDYPIPIEHRRWSTSLTATLVF